MDRRTFIKTSLIGSGAFMLGLQGCSDSAPDGITSSKPHLQGTKKLFLNLGTCSQLLFYILNREFGFPMRTEERASDLLAGGVLQKGHQCGMLWGASLAAGAEAFRRNDDLGLATGKAITTSQHLIESFSNRARSVNCRGITNCDFSSKLSMGTYLLTGRFLNCFFLAEDWAPEAIQSATIGLSQDKTDVLRPPISCASEVVKRMGASDEEMAMVAGFAGGLGLSGNGCGALSAAVWMNTLSWCRKHPEKSPPFFNNSYTKNILEAFNDATDSRMLCNQISGQNFRTIDDHTEFMKNGGCDKLVNALARS